MMDDDLKLNSDLSLRDRLYYLEGSEISGRVG